MYNYRELEECISYILLHEFTHIRRLDCLSKLLLTAALCLYWWNPLVWIMVHLANTDMEVACDEAVLQRLGESLRKHYAAMLVELESQRVSPSPLYSCFGKNATKERIRAMMKHKRMTRLSWAQGYRRVTARQLQKPPQYWPSLPTDVVKDKRKLYHPVPCPLCGFCDTIVLPETEQFEIVGKRGNKYTMKRKCLNPQCEYYW